MPARTKILFRCDGSQQIGLGHVVRSCALAMMLGEKFECSFFIRDPSPALSRYIKEAGFALTSLPGTVIEEEAAAWAEHLEGDEILVLDGYAFNTRYQQLLKTKGNKIVCIDDIHAYKFVADIVINHAPGVDESMYSLSEGGKLFTGPQFALIRKSFLQQALNGKKKGTDDTIFVCLGGADPSNTTLSVIQNIYTRAQHLTRNITVNLVLGSAYKYEDTLALQETGMVQLNIFRNLSAELLIEVMQRCSIAICSASTICFEYAAVSTGTIFLCKTADNQAEFYTHMLQNKFAEDFFSGFYPEDGSFSRQDQHKFADLLDGKQRQRILDIFEELVR
ncbi:UDP-2,4-diacetamido-2,4,6-trideoxy-beta-L-altropyranose hydrolase [Chitinophaga barathri]|nr:UDP-2,4-diacetamido-2,4,6-trideoxy-beta-L-altropyranose hydrolase [Chitinophaga barathri]